MAGGKLLPHTGSGGLRFTTYPHRGDNAEHSHVTHGCGCVGLLYNHDMPLQAQILGGPRDGEYIPVTTHRVFMLDDAPSFAYTSPEAQADPALRPWPVGVYDLERWDDCQLTYTRRPGPASGQ